MSVDRSRPRKPLKFLQPYIDARWGIKNHWYPALFSHEVSEDEVKGVQIAGEHIALRRANGRIYALRDECLHRGVRLSARPTCLTKDTISCWYHGFTYELESGDLCDIIASQEDPLIGKVSLRTYAVREVNGMIFVFIGDEDYPRQPLEYDLPLRVPDDYEHRTAYLLDEDTVLLGIRRHCVGNWRLAVESGGDPGHVMIHRLSPLVLSQNLSFPLSVKLADKDSILINDKGWPKGIGLDYTTLEHVMENKRLGVKTYGDTIRAGLNVTMYLPGVLYVENWPNYGLAQYEWYVPTDDRHHVYWQVLAKTCKTDEEKKDFKVHYDNCWEELALKSGFNDDDIFAREAMEPFYEDERGWEEETLFSLDQFVVEWRKLVVNNARGIQSPPKQTKG